MNSTKKKSSIIETYSLTFIDLLCTLSAWALAVFVRYHYKENGPLDFQTSLIACLLLMLCSTVYNFLADGNKEFFERDDYAELTAVCKCTVSVLVVTLVLLFFLQLYTGMSRMVLGLFTINNIVLTYCVHSIFKNWMLRSYWKSGSGSKVLLVTTVASGTTTMEQLKINFPWNCELVAACVLDAKTVGYDLNGVEVVANEENLYEVASKLPIDEVLLDLPADALDKQKELVRNLQQMGVICHCCLHMFYLDESERTIGMFGNKAVVSYEISSMDYRRELLKRTLDIIGAVIGLFATGMVFPFIWLRTKMKREGSAIISWERIGRNGRKFRMYSFRSGKWIDRWYLNKLPHFYNVLVGEMSLVGTRAPSEEEFYQYTLHSKRRLSMAPGLTGSWRLQKRTLEFDEIIEADLFYIDHWSVTKDIQILLKTAKLILVRRVEKRANEE